MVTDAMSFESLIRTIFILTPAGHFFIRLVALILNKNDIYLRENWFLEINTIKSQQQSQFYHKIWHFSLYCHIVTSIYINLNYS